MVSDDKALATRTNNTGVVPVDQNVFLAFDRLDDDQIIAEMKGAALQAYVYEFTQGGQQIRGLSKSGTDDATRIMAVKYGEALREVDCWLERDDDEEALFKAKVERWGLRDDGRQILLDVAIGHKRQAKKVNGRLNAFWYETGAQKALRNAKQKLIPETIKQAIIASYVEAGKVRRVTRDDVAPRQASPRQAPVVTEYPDIQEPPAQHVTRHEQQKEAVRQREFNESVQAQQSPEPPRTRDHADEPVAVCEDCALPVPDGKVGGVMSPGYEVAAETHAKTGKYLCAKCYKKRVPAA